MFKTILFQNRLGLYGAPGGKKFSLIKRRVQPMEVTVRGAISRVLWYQVSVDTYTLN